MKAASILEASKVLKGYLEGPSCIIAGFDVPDSIWGPFIEAIDSEESSWVSVKDKMPDDRIRVIAGDHLSVIGDCFFGHASGPDLWNEAAKGRFPVERWNERLWRYSRDESPLPDHIQPTVWMPLPEVPKREVT